MVYQQTLQAKLHSLGYPDPIYKEVKICETEVKVELEPKIEQMEVVARKDVKDVKVVGKLVKESVERVSESESESLFVYFAATVQYSSTF